MTLGQPDSAAMFDLSRTIIPMTRHDALMTISEMCATFEVTPRALRFYESKELLAPIRQGTRRLYTKADRARLKLIMRGKRFGVSLEDIRQVLDLYDRTDTNQAQLVRSIDLARTRLVEMESQRNDLDEAIAEIKDFLAKTEDSLQSQPV